MAFKEDLTGQQFFNLKVLSYNNTTKKWKCQCVCGSIIEVETSLLKAGRKKSCNCTKYIRTKNIDGNHYKLRKLFNMLSFLKEGDWTDWEDFKQWAFDNGYGELLSYRKKVKKEPYSKKNLEFGIKCNGKFLPIKEAKEYHIFYNRSKNNFFINFKFNGITISQNDINTINELYSKHKKLYKRYFKKKSFFE